MLYVFHLQLSYTLTSFLSSLLYGSTDFQIHSSWGLTGGQLAHLPGVCMQTGSQNGHGCSGGGGKDTAALYSLNWLLSTQDTNQKCCSLLPTPVPHTLDTASMNSSSGWTAGCGGADPATHIWQDSRCRCPWGMVDGKNISVKRMQNVRGLLGSTALASRR